MKYVVRVDQNALRAQSDPMDAVTVLKVAKAWQSHGDRAVRIVEAPNAGGGEICGDGDGGETGIAPIARSWSIREFIAFLRGPTAPKPQIREPAGNAAGR